MSATTRRARQFSPAAFAPKNLALANAATVNPTAFGRRWRDVVPGCGLPDALGLGAKRRIVPVRKFLLPQPQMNHFVLQNFAQGLFGRVARNAAHFITRAALKRLAHKRNRKLNQVFSLANVARRAGQTPIPTDFTRAEFSVEKFGVELLVEGLEVGLKHRSQSFTSFHGART